MQNKYLVFCSITVALAGFLFGFDTVVISGVEQSLEQLWSPNEGDKWFHGVVVMASALWGTVAGAMFGGIPTDRIGRKKTLILIGFLYIVSAIGAAMANDPWVFAVFRFLGGLGIGASTVAAPSYITEIAPDRNRGQLVALYQFNIVFGILMAYVSNYLLNNLGPDAWRWMIGVQALPAVIYTIMVNGVPESPRWLLSRKQDTAAARASLLKIDPATNADAFIQQIQQEQAAAPDQTNETIFIQRYRKPLILAFLVAFFNQFSGINAFLYYQPRIFELAGLDKSEALLGGVAIGVVNLIFTLLGVLLIDRYGRRQLMLIGSIGYILSLTAVAYAMSADVKGVLIPILFILFIASHAVGQGAVIWVFISEIFPTHLRAHGQAFGSSVHWWLAAIIPAMMPVLLKTAGPAPVFGFFALMMVFQLLFVLRMMPETKGVSLEELERQLV
jgi:sugar porter (SP) family MFS transporter